MEITPNHRTRGIAHREPVLFIYFITDDTPHHTPSAVLPLPYLLPTHAFSFTIPYSKLYLTLLVPFPVPRVDVPVWIQTQNLKTTLYSLKPCKPRKSSCSLQKALSCAHTPSHTLPTHTDPMTGIAAS